MSFLSLRERLVGERRAVALLALGFYTTLFLLVAIAQGGAWARCFGALAVTYAIAFLAVGAEWFWGRWFAMGIATSGMTMALLGIITGGFNIGLAIWGGIHALIYLPLVGREMADRYENRPAWRERYKLNEHGVARLKRAVHSTATALPTLIFYSLAPRNPDGSLSLVCLGMLAVAAVGFVGLLRLRTWGLMVLGVVGVWVGVDALTMGVQVAAPFGITRPIWELSVVGMVTAGLLGLALLAFARPLYLALRPPADG